MASPPRACARCMCSKSSAGSDTACGRCCWRSGASASSASPRPSRSICRTPKPRTSRRARSLLPARPRSLTALVKSSAEGQGRASSSATVPERCGGAWKERGRSLISRRGRRTTTRWRTRRASSPRSCTLRAARLARTWRRSPTLSARGSLIQLRRGPSLPHDPHKRVVRNGTSSFALRAFRRGAAPQRAGAGRGRWSKSSVEAPQRSSVHELDQRVVHCPPRKGRGRDTSGGLFTNNFVSTTKVSAPENPQRVAAKKPRRGAESVWSTRVRDAV